MKIGKIAVTISLVIAWFAYISTGSADFTQSFLPRAFGPTGDILNVETIWELVGILSNKFDTPIKDNHYVQGQYLAFSRGNPSQANYDLTGDSIKFSSPTSLRGMFVFQWQTFTKGSLWDTKVDEGSGHIEYAMNNYKYDVKFSEDTSKKFTATIENFVWDFDIQLSPVFDGQAKDITKQLFPDLSASIKTTLNTNFCPKIKTQLGTSIKSVLTAAQTSQSLSWSYGGFSTKKTLSLTPTNTVPFKDGNFVITTNGTLQLNDWPQQEQFKMERSLNEISDDSLKAQQEDICFIFTDELVDTLIRTNVNFFQQYKIVVNQDSGNQRYYPFNLWQFWEATLYDNELYKMIGNEVGKYKQTDPVTMNCNFTAPQDPSTITSDGKLSVTLNYKCTLDLKDSLDGNKIKHLYEFTFDHKLSASFYLTGNILNARVETGEVVLTGKQFMDDLRARFQFPLNLEIINNAKLFGANGIKFNYITGKQIKTSRVGENLEICLF